LDAAAITLFRGLFVRIIPAASAVDVPHATTSWLGPLRDRVIRFSSICQVEMSSDPREVAVRVCFVV